MSAVILVEIEGLKTVTREYMGRLHVSCVKTAIKTWQDVTIIPMSIHNMIYLPYNDKENDEDDMDWPLNRRPPTIFPTFTPDYVDVYISINVLGFDTTKNPFPGFWLLDIGANKYIAKKRKNKMNKYVKSKQYRWNKDRKLRKVYKQWNLIDEWIKIELN